MRGCRRGAFLPVEVVPELSSGLLLPFDHSAAQHAPFSEQLPQAAPRPRVFCNQLGDDISGPGKRFFAGFDPQLRVDEALRQMFELGLRPRLSFEQLLRQRFETPLPRHLGPGSPLGPVGQVKVLEFGQGCRRPQLLFERGGQQFALEERLENCVPASLELLQPRKAIAHRGNLHLVQRTRRFFTVAGDEGDRPPFAEQAGDRSDLRHTHAELAGEPGDARALFRVGLFG